MKKTNTNGRLKGKTANNSLPLNNPMSGVFDFFGSGTAPLSQPFEMGNSTSYYLISLQRVLLSYAYVLHGPLRTLVDQPVYDAFRGGITVKSDEVSPEELEELHKEIKKLKLVKTIVNGLRWDRLFGGAGIIVNVDEDYSTPLNINKINEKTKLSFKVGDRWELAWSGTPNDPRSFFNYYGLKIHQSRVAKIVGEEAPSLVKQRLQGWGMSSFECVLREINAYFKNNNVIFELLDEAKIDVWKIKGFNAQVLKAAAANTTAKRIQIANSMKNFLNAITLDSEDDYEQKQMTFSGLSDILEQIRIGIAAAVRMPMAKIFGLASKGFASGEDDIENYNAIVEAQRDRACEVLEMVIPIVCMKVFGFVPDDLEFEWKPLRVLSAEQEQNVLNAKFTRLSTLYSQGILSPQEYAEALKQDNILTMETAVSKGEEPQPPMSELGLDESDEPKSEESKAKPSAGKKPTKEKD